MSEESNQDVQQDELTSLKKRAELLGISFHPSIGVDKLREKVNEKLAETEDSQEGSQGEVDEEEQAPSTTPGARKPGESTHQFRLRKRKEASELVRIQITCMNPNKKDWESEYFCAGNSVVGTFRNVVPFDVEWHVPRIIFNQIKERQCQIFVTKKTSRGREREGKLIREFSVAELPALTEKELKDLAQRQAMASGTSE